MDIKKDFLDKINNCAWFENCGDGSYDRFEVVVVKDREKAIKSVTSMKWGNICLEAQNDLTSYLFFNQRESYEKDWNNEVVHIKQEYWSKMSDPILAALEARGLPEEVLKDVQFNVVALFMANFYSECYSSAFYEQMLEIYLSGHLPCGWSGGKKSGKFMVY